MPHSTPSAPCVKTCTKCGQTKPATIEYFSAHKRGKYGLHPSCKECRRAYYQKNQEREIARARAYYAENSEYVRERTRLYFDTNKASISAKKRAHRKANRDSYSERDRMYYVRNKARMNQKTKEWRAANPEKARVLGLKKRSIRRMALGVHTADDIKRQYESQKGSCYYCKIRVGDDYHVDHVIPLSRGGSNGPENIVIACPTCNLEKHNRLPHEWPKGGKLL